LMKWHLEDTVDDWERNRNNIIYYNYQNNRNPFIDHPEYAQLIWGTFIDIGINESSPKIKKLIKILDMEGRETTPQKNKVLIYLYSDGSIEKVFKI